MHPQLTGLSIFFHIGRVNSICSGYAVNAISEKDAIMMLNSLKESANKDLKDSKKYIQ